MNTNRKRSRPRIAVTVSRRTGWRTFPFFALGVWLAGGRPLRWTAGRPRDLDAVDGLIVGGGDDIAPDLYGGKLVPSARIDADRDALERALVEEAARIGRPVLGICRGAQMINIALGGSLHQEAYETFSDSDRHWTVLPKKTVHVEAGTGLAGISGTEPMVVNALHHQAVDRLGDGVRVAARDRGGMIQAVERPDGPFTLGVQWHPEYLFYAHRQRALFKALVDSAAQNLE